jgi:hypothetical protein
MCDHLVEHVALCIGFIDMRRIDISNHDRETLYFLECHGAGKARGLPNFQLHKRAVLYAVHR